MIKFILILFLISKISCEFIYAPCEYEKTEHECIHWCSCQWDNQTGCGIGINDIQPCDDGHYIINTIIITVLSMLGCCVCITITWCLSYEYYKYLQRKPKTIKFYILRDGE
jgi:hypothetical protein